MRPPIRLPDLSSEAIAELDELYRTTHDVRLRTRAQMILLAAEQHLTRPRLPRSCAATTRRCAAGSSVTWPKASRAWPICHGLVHQAR